MKSNKILFIIVFILFVAGCEYYYMGHKVDLEGPYTVASVSEEGIITTTDHQTIKLKDINSINDKGIEFLNEKTVDKDIYLDMEGKTTDSEGNTLAVVYLKDKKTQIQKFLIKGGMAE